MTSNNIKKMAFQYLKGYTCSIIILLVLIITETIITSITPVFYGRIIDYISLNGSKTFFYLLLLYGLMLFISVIISSVESYITEVLGNKIFKEYQSILFNKILHSKFQELEKLEIGELMAHLTADLGTIIEYDISIVTTYSFIFFNFFIPLILAVSINAELTIFSLFFLPVSLLIYKNFKYKRKSIYKKHQELTDLYNSFTINILQNIPSIKSFRIESHIETQYYKIIDKIFSIEKKRSSADNSINFLNNATNIIFQVSFLYLANIIVCDGKLTLGLMITLGMYINRIFTSIDMLQKVQLNEQNVLISLQRINELTGLQVDEQKYEPYVTNAENTIFELRIENIYFAYNDTLDVIKDLSLSINSTGLYSIIGKNGSGKSTLLKLLQCFYLPQKGNIIIHGNSYKECDIGYIRNLITYVQKEPFILKDSLLENIRLYSNINVKVIDEYCDMVGLSSYITTLPKGIYTEISADSLSSGQRQKLSFARALAHKAEIILFDEITSDLDGISEKILTNIMKKLSKSAIVISISHRLQTITESDCIFVLDSGTIVDSGTFEYLKNHSNVFSELFNL